VHRVFGGEPLRRFDVRYRFAIRRMPHRGGGATFQVIPGGAHAYLWQKAAEANAAVLAFLQQH